MYMGTLTTFSEADVIDDDCILERKFGDRDLQVAFPDFGTYMKRQQYKYENLFCYILNESHLLK